VSRVVLSSLILGLVLAMPLPATAHEVLYTVERGRAIALKAYFADGEALAYTQYEIYGPTDPKIPYQKGRTDRGGYVAFMPDKSGKWRVKIWDDTGHGLDKEIVVDQRNGSANSATSDERGSVSTAAFVLRPLLGLVAVVSIFAVLFFVYRRQKTQK
jgi:nickel transport protein